MIEKRASIADDLLGYDAVFFGDSSVGGWMGVGDLCQPGGDVVCKEISE